MSVLQSLTLIIYYPNNPLFFIGGCSFIVFANCINKSLCSFVNLFGVLTITVNTKSPCTVELTDLNPLFLIINLVPV